MKGLPVIFAIVLCSFFTITADVSLSGIVKKTGGATGISGVKVSLSNQKELHSITDSNGYFKIEQTSLKSYLPKEKTFHLNLKNRTLHFSSHLPASKCLIAVFSVTGKTLLQKSLDQLYSANQFITLPSFSSGIYLVRLSIEGVDYTYSLVSAGNQIFLTSHSLDTKYVHGNLSISKSTAVIDTLVAEKSGYNTMKIPLSSYTQNDIIITMESSSADTTVRKGLTVYFIRHAETVANASGQQGGGGPLEDHDTLTQLGEKQVEELKNFLVEENIKPDLVVVSPSLRTQKTIEPFLKALNIKAEIWVELNECCGDEPSGEPLPTERPAPRWKVKVEPKSENFTLPSEEDKYYWWPQSFEEGLFMVMTAQKRLLQRFNQSGKSVIVVGHAVNGGLFLGLLRGYDMINTKPERPVYLINTAVHKLTQDTVSGIFTLKQNLNKPPTK